MPRRPRVSSIFAWVGPLLLLVQCQNANVRPTGDSSNLADPAHPPPAPAPGGGSDAAGAGPGRPGAGLALPDAGAAGPAAVVPPGEMKCAEDIHQAERAPVDLLLLVDTSGSMTDSAGTRSKWAMVKDALVGFLKDPRSAGLGVGLQFFPLLPPEKACTGEGDCPGGSPLQLHCHEWKACGAPGDAVAGTRECDVDPCPAGVTCLPVGRCALSGKPCLGMGMTCPGGMAGDTCGPRGRSCRINATASCELRYDQPVVPIGPLPQQAAALIAAIDDRVPRGGTPMGPAVEGALAHLRAHVAAHPDRQVALVLATDGLPDGFCSRNYVQSISDALAGARAVAPALPAYVIGVFSPAEVAEAMPGLTRLAMSGGTGAPTFVNANADLSQGFQKALDQIRGTVLPCEFKIPPPSTGMLDFGKVNVRLLLGAGNEDIPYVGSADRCDPVRGGWHYDRDPATGPPATVKVCEATCRKIKSDNNGRVEVRFGCKTLVID